MARKSSVADEEIKDGMGRINRVISKAKRESTAALDVIVGVDFNGHDQLLGDDGVVSTARKGEGALTIQMMAENDLQSLLPQGIPTWYSDASRQSSTIDLMLV